MNAKVVMLLAAWGVSLLGVGVWGQGGSGQLDADGRWRVYSSNASKIGPVITGADIGFQRVAPAPGAAADTVVGYFVVKIGDEWMRVSALRNDQMFALWPRQSA